MEDLHVPADPLDADMEREHSLERRPEHDQRKHRRQRDRRGGPDSQRESTPRGDSGDEHRYPGGAAARDRGAERLVFL